MYQVDNRTDWSAGLYPGWSRQGKRQFTLVIKAGFTFDLHGELTPLPHPPIEETDRYRGEPGASSLAAACETVPFKEGGELLFSGTAHPPESGRTVTEVEVGMRFSEGRVWSKTLRVFGRRYWKSKLLMAVPGVPEALEPVALIYENAYGGCDQGNADNPFAANPVGKGYTRKGLKIKDLEMPQIEIGPRYISSPTSRPAPAGFGPISPLWEPRLALSAALSVEAGSGACPWGGKAPDSLFNAAPHDQRFPRPFTGGETLNLKGMVPEAPHGVMLRLPESRPDVQIFRGGKMTGAEVTLDTVLVDTDKKELHLLFRGALPREMKTEESWLIVEESA